MSNKPKVRNGKYVITLILHREWFDMILSGDKKEEYRGAIEQGYPNLLGYCGRFTALDSGDGFDTWVNIPYTKLVASPEKCVICFCNGYAKDRDYFYIDFKSLHVGKGKSKWGAVEGGRYFVLTLGDVIERNLKT